MNFGKRHENLILFFCTLILSVLGTVMVYSATSVSAGANPKLGYDTAYFFKRQVLFLIVGASVAVLLTRIDYDIYRKRMAWIMAATFVLLTLVFIPGINHTANGASRWINMRIFTFQPSELAKFVLIAFAAFCVDRKGEDPKNWKKVSMPVLAVTFAYLAVILKQPDFGMVVVIGTVCLALLFIAGFPWKFMAASLGACVVGAGLLIAAKPYRMARLKAFIDPVSQAQTAGYAVLQSLIAFSNGGFLGMGIGSGRQKLFYLPEMHTDYIFCVIGEELGFAGVVAVGACFLTMAFVGFRIARRARDLFGRYLAMGIASVIGIQALMNIMVGLKMLPPKGMVLPFISYGGSSLIIHLAAMGVLINISMKGAETFVADSDNRGRWNRRTRFSGDSSG
jgi:cell division protein FtsW